MDLSLFYFLATDRKGMGNDETIQKKYDDMFDEFPAAESEADRKE